MEWVTEKGCAYGATFTIATPGATMVVTVQLTDYAGNALTVKNGVKMYMSTDTTGDLVEVLGAEATVATHGIVNILITKSVYLLITEDTGIVALTLDGDGAVTNYMNIVLPNGKVVTSGAIAFSA